MVSRLEAICPITEASEADEAGLRRHQDVTQCSLRLVSGGVMARAGV